MIINNKENIVLAYFTLDKLDYVLYTVDDGIPLLYLSKVIYKEKEIDLEKIDKDKNKVLRKVLAEFLVNDHNYAFLKSIGYNSLELDQLKANKINQKGYQTISLTKNQYETITMNNKVKRKEIKKERPNLGILLMLVIILIVILILFF